MTFTPPVEQTPAQPPENYAFIMNVGALTDAANYALAPGHELRRARRDEVGLIKNTLKSYAPAPHNLFPYLWEGKLPPRPGSPIEPLPETEWRYFVIGFRGSNNTINELVGAFDLTGLELEVGFIFLVGYGIISMPARLFHVLENVGQDNSFFVDVSMSDIEEIRAVLAQLQKQDNRLVDLQGLMMQLRQLKEFTRYSPLRFLGYFAILESLLTHAPKPSDPYDSITRQVKKKLALLNQRFPRAIDYAPFGGAAPDKIWAKMYEYRSLVAHGGNPKFTEDLAVLKDKDLALALVKETVKRVIRQALLEPQLLLDLKDC